MIPPQVAMDRWRAENDGCSRRAGPPLGSVYTLGPGGGTVSTVPRRRTVLNDVSVSVEQPGEEPTLVSSECSHDVVGLYAHKGTMWNTDDHVK